jgi:hypothetical protein
VSVFISPNKQRKETERPKPEKQKTRVCDSVTSWDSVSFSVGTGWLTLNGRGEGLS